MRKRAATSGLIHTRACMYTHIYMYIHKVEKHSDVHAYGDVVNILAVSTVQPSNVYLRNKYLLNNVDALDERKYVQRRESFINSSHGQSVHGGWVSVCAPRTWLDSVILNYEGLWLLITVERTCQTCMCVSAVCI